MTDALREAVKAAMADIRGFDHYWDRRSDAAIRAVLTHYAENGPSDAMEQAAMPKRSFGGTRDDYSDPYNSLVKMMRAALAERG